MSLTRFDPSLHPNLNSEELFEKEIEHYIDQYKQPDLLGPMWNDLLKEHFTQKAYEVRKIYNTHPDDFFDLANKLISIYTFTESAQNIINSIYKDLTDQERALLLNRLINSAIDHFDDYSKKLDDYILEFFQDKPTLEHFIYSDLINLSTLTILKLNSIAKLANDKNFTFQQLTFDSIMEYFGRLSLIERDILNNSFIFKDIYSSFNVKNFDEFLHKIKTNDGDAIADISKLFSRLVSKFEEEWGKRYLQRGDIVFDFENAPKLEPSDESKRFSDGRLYHVMVYESDKVYHSFSSREATRTGVRSHPVSQVIDSRKPKLGQWIVFECKDLQLRESLAKVIQRWDPMERIKAEEQKSGKRVERLDTPYSHKREADKNPELFEIFRAFRASIRNLKKEPLSKNKGISCNQFVRFSLKAAAIQYLFPTIPDDIQKAFDEIEKLQVIVNEEKGQTKKIKKLKNIPDAQQIFSKFNELVKTHLKNHPFFFEFLSAPAKGRTIREFLQHDVILKFPQLFNFSGSIYFKEGRLPLVVPINIVPTLSLPKHDNSYWKECENVVRDLSEDNILKIIKWDINKRKNNEDMWIALGKTNPHIEKAMIIVWNTPNKETSGLKNEITDPELINIQSKLDQIFISFDSMEVLRKEITNELNRELKPAELNFLDIKFAMIRNGSYGDDINTWRKDLYFLIHHSPLSILGITKEFYTAIEKLFSRYGNNLEVKNVEEKKRDTMSASVLPSLSLLSSSHVSHHPSEPNPENKGPKSSSLPDKSNG